MMLNRYSIGAAALLAILFVAPPLGYYILIGSAPSLTPEKAYEKLAAPGSRAVLADIRPEDEYKSLHIRGSRHWDNAAIMSATALSEIPDEFRDRPVYLICESGITSASAARKLRSLGHGEAYSMEGGISLWTGKVRPAESPQGEYVSLEDAGGSVSAFPEKQISTALQYMLWIIAAVIKPLYMTLAFILIILFRRYGSAGTAIVRWGLAAFLAGEIFCAINFLIFRDSSLLLEYLHVYGMVIFYALLLYAIASTMEKRVIHSLEPDRRCAILPLCGRCWKQDSAMTCRLRIIYDITVIFLIASSLMPLLAENRPLSYNSMVLGDPVHFYQPMAIQLAESKVFPVIAMALLALALVFNRFAGERAREQATFYFAFGAGYFGFGLFRLIIESLFGETFWWFSFWEEFTELLFISAIGILLYLFKKSSHGAAETT